MLHSSSGPLPLSFNALISSQESEIVEGESNYLNNLINTGNFCIESASMAKLTDFCQSVIHLANFAKQYCIYKGNENISKIFNISLPLVWAERHYPFRSWRLSLTNLIFVSILLISWEQKILSPPSLSWMPLPTTTYISLN